MKHAMLDLETYGTGRDAAIKAIGLVRFDPVAGKVAQLGDISGVLYQRINLAQSPQAGVIDASTVEWWLTQSDAAREELLKEPNLPLHTALVQIVRWLELPEYGKVEKLWSNGPTFDEIILRDAYIRHDIKWPFHYRASRCCRTIFDMAKTAGFQPPEKTHLQHNALADSFFQAEGVCLMYNHLGIAVNAATTITPEVKE